MKDMYHKYFDDFEIGEITKCGGRQMTEADTRLSVGVIGGSHPLHMDPKYCATRPDVGSPIVQGSVVLGYIDACFYDWVCPGGEVIVIPDGYEKIRFMKPIYMDDIIQAEFVISDLEETGGRFGRVTAEVTVFNQDNVPVTFAKQHFMVQKEEVQNNGYHKIL